MDFEAPLEQTIYHTCTSVICATLFLLSVARTIETVDFQSIVID